MTEEDILKAIPSTEPADFGEFCGALGSEKPDNRDDWRIMFSLLHKLEAEGYVDVGRAVGFGDNIDTLILTESGAARVRSLK